MDSDSPAQPLADAPADTSSKFLQGRRHALKILAKLPAAVATGGALAAGGIAIRDVDNKIERTEPSEIEKQFLSELSAAMMKAGKSGRPEEVTFGDFTLTVQPTRSKGQGR